MRHNGKLYLNLKCDPLEADFLRQAFTGIIPGYHMNHIHWNTIIIGSDVPEEEIKRQIGSSYDLIKPKVKRTPRKNNTAYNEDKDLDKISQEEMLWRK
jgi:predicted DNA-binding protein (MmcQ/YjbR family)